MAREADYDVDFFVEMVRSGMQPATDVRYSLGDDNDRKTTKRTGRPGSRKKAG
jgi:hypothetical protein